MLANSKLPSLEPGFLNFSHFFIVLAVFYSSSRLWVYKIGMQIKPILVDKPKRYSFYLCEYV